MTTYSLKTIGMKMNRQYCDCPVLCDCGGVGYNARIAEEERMSVVCDEKALDVILEKAKWQKTKEILSEGFKDHLGNEIYIKAIIESLPLWVKIVEGEKL